VFGALDELLAADLVHVDRGVYAFRQRAAQQLIERNIEETARRACHRRIGLALLAKGPGNATERLHAARHLLRGGEDARGAELVVTAVDALDDISAQVDERGIDALELALTACEHLGRLPADAMRIRLTLLPCAFLFDHALVRHGLPAIDRLEQDSGMAFVREQDPDAALMQRALTGLARASERYQGQPECERVFDPVRSAIELGKALLSMQAIYSTQLDVERARECAARFEPLSVLSEVAMLCHDAAVAAVHALVGRIEPALELQRGVAARTQELLMLPQEPSESLRLRALLAAMAYIVALRVAFTEPKEALRMADLIDRQAPSRHKAGAAQLRWLASYLMGDVGATERFQAQYEERLVRYRQHGSSGVDLAYRIRAYALGGDLLGL
jgi:hypothetical protein